MVLHWFTPPPQKKPKTTSSGSFSETKQKSAIQHKKRQKKNISPFLGSQSVSGDSETVRFEPCKNKKTSALFLRQ